MTKTFLLVRHSKAEDRNNMTEDIDRPLSAEGIADSFKIADILLSSGIKPDMTLVSSARRTIHTARVFQKILNIDEKDLIISRNLYYSSSKTILNQIIDIAVTINCVMVVAHNPGISDLARRLSSGRVTFMENTQVVIFEYDIVQWNQLIDQKPVSIRSYRTDGKSL